MSDNNAPMSLLDQLKAQHQQFILQRDQAQLNLNQLIGAIYACDMMIVKHEEEIKKAAADAQQADNEHAQGENNVDSEHKE